MRSLVRSVLVALAAATALVAAGAGIATAALSSGYHDFTCHPSAAHPEPLVLLHGLGGMTGLIIGCLAGGIGAGLDRRERAVVLPPFS
ncbi:hypothetical protein GCM10010198_39650 [Nocardia seriolae]